MSRFLANGDVRRLILKAEVLPRASDLLLGCKGVRQVLLEGLRSVNRPLTRIFAFFKGHRGKKTMLGSGGSPSTEVLSCQQQCENDVFKGKSLESSNIRGEGRALFRHGI